MAARSCILAQETSRTGEAGTPESTGSQDTQTRLSNQTTYTAEAKLWALHQSEGVQVTNFTDYSNHIIFPRIIQFPSNLLPFVAMQNCSVVDENSGWSDIQLLCT